MRCKPVRAPPDPADAERAIHLLGLLPEPRAEILRRDINNDATRVGGDRLG
jgi:hypothetical protein